MLRGLPGWNEFLTQGRLYAEGRVTRVSTATYHGRGYLVVAHPEGEMRFLGAAKTNKSLPGRAAVRNARHGALDMLRALATLAIFIFHSGAPYVAGDWHISSPSKSFVLTVWNAWLLMWAIPLFFVLSGWSMCLALPVYSVQRLVSERIRRLLIPFLFGVFVIAPPQVYLERLQRGQFDGSFIEFYPHYFNAPYLEIGGVGNFAWMGLHLWYLLMLLVLSLFCLPLFAWLHENSQTPLARRLNLWMTRPLAILAFATPLALIERLFGNVGLGGLTVGRDHAKRPRRSRVGDRRHSCATVARLRGRAGRLWTIQSVMARGAACFCRLVLGHCSDRLRLSLARSKRSGVFYTQRIIVSDLHSASDHHRHCGLPRREGAARCSGEIRGCADIVGGSDACDLHRRDQKIPMDEIVVWDEKDGYVTIGISCVETWPAQAASVT